MGTPTSASSSLVNRTYDMCADIDDEYHMVLVCSKYEILRKKYIKRFYYVKPPVHKFILLLNSANRKDIFNLGIVVYKSFKQ